MKLMIDISDSTYEAIMARDWKNAGWLFSEEMKAIHDGTPIPDNPQPCEDAISRKALISHIEMQSREWGEDYDAQQILGDIEDMPSVKPQEKTGHWDSRTCKCSECGYQITFSEYTEHKYKYCPNCGAKMVEQQESEG